jgi:hypothetical protein
MPVIQKRIGKEDVTWLGKEVVSGFGVNVYWR